MNYFFDTSAFAKVYHRELGTESVQGIIRNPESRVFVSNLTLVEINSVSAIKVRTGILTEAEADALLGQVAVSVSIGQLLVLRLDNEHFEVASALLTRRARHYFLRTLDALQLASALTLKKQIGLGYFVTADRKLAVVAELEGLTIVNPER